MQVWRVSPARPLRPSPPCLAPPSLAPPCLAPLRPSRQPCKHAPSACAHSFSKSGRRESLAPPPGGGWVGDGGWRKRDSQWCIGETETCCVHDVSRPHALQAYIGEDREDHVTPSTWFLCGASTSAEWMATRLSAACCVLTLSETQPWARHEPLSLDTQSYTRHTPFPSSRWCRSPLLQLCALTHPCPDPLALCLHVDAMLIRGVPVPND
jgi:hypothetical protein